VQGHASELRDVPADVWDDRVAQTQTRGLAEAVLELRNGADLSAQAQLPHRQGARGERAIEMGGCNRQRDGQIAGV